ncbi:MAG: trigger factor [Dehalococcoidales bacterium]
MKVLSNKIENRQALLTIELEPAEVEQSLEKSYQRLVKKTDIPGFRQGKAPRAVLERHIGKENLLEDALDYLLPRVCADAIEQQKLKVIARPDIKVTQTAPVVFEATVPLTPTVKLADYYRIKMKPKPAKLKKEDVSTVLGQLRRRSATWEPVKRAVKAKDLVIFDVESSVEDKPFIGEKGAQYRVIGGSSLPAPGFAEQLLGMKSDQEKEFKLKLPENYSDSTFAGKEVSFKVKVLEIKEERLPPLDDDFARRVGPGIETMDSLREQISADLKKRAEEKARVDFEERVVDALVDKSELEYPRVLVDMELDQMVNQYRERLGATARSPEEYMERLKGAPQEELLREKYRPVAIQRVTGSLVLDKVTEAEKIEVGDPEIDAEIERMTQNAGDRRDEQKKLLNSPETRGSIRDVLITQKTIQRLVDIAKGSGKKNKSQKEAK